MAAFHKERRYYYPGPWETFSIHSEYYEPKQPERRDWIERSHPLVQKYIKNWRDGFPIPGRKRMKR